VTSFLILLIYFLALQFQHELKAHELQLVRERLKGTTHHRLAEEVRELEEQCQQLDQEIVEAKETEENCNKKLKEVEYKIKHAKELKEKELKVWGNKPQYYYTT